MGFCVDGYNVVAPRVSGDPEPLPSASDSAPCPAPTASGDSKYVQNRGGILLAQAANPANDSRFASDAPAVAGHHFPAPVPRTIPEFQTEHYESGVVRAESYKGTKYPKGSYVRYYTNGKPAKIVFSGETEFQGIKFQCGDYVKLYYDSGKIESIATHGPVEINGHLFSPVFRNFPTKNNFLAGVTLAKKMDPEETSFIEMQNGVVYKGVAEEGFSHGDIYIPAGAVVGFHRNGVLREAAFDIPQPLFDFQVTSVSFEDKGNLAEIQLHNAAMIGLNNTVFEADSRVRFHPNGEVAGGTLAFDDMVDGISCKGGSYIVFHSNSMLRSCTVVRDFTLNGVMCAAVDDEISISEDGKLEMCNLSEKQTFRAEGIKKKLVFLPGSEPTYFSRPGVVSNGQLLSGQRVYGIKFGETPSSQIKLDNMGVSGRLGEDATIDGISLEKGTWVRVSPDGKLLEIMVRKNQRIRGVLLKADEYYQLYDNGKPKLIEMP